MTYIGTSIVECQDKFNATLLVLQLAGWNIQPEKTSSIPVQRLSYLRLITDTVRNEILCGQRKNRSSELHAKRLFAQHFSKISFKARDLASLLGKKVTATLYICVEKCNTF